MQHTPLSQFGHIHIAQIFIYLFAIYCKLFTKRNKQHKMLTPVLSIGTAIVMTLSSAEMFYYI